MQARDDEEASVEPCKGNSLPDSEAPKKEEE